RAIDRMTASDGNADRGTNRSAAVQDLSDHVGRDLVERHAEYGQRHDWPAAHGIDIRKRIARRNTTKVDWVVDHRHEEIGGCNQAGVFVKLPYGCIIAGLGSHDELSAVHYARLFGKQLLQDRRCQFAPATPTMCEARQTNLRYVHFLAPIAGWTL